MMTTVQKPGVMTTLSRVAAAIGSQLRGADVSFTGVTTDSRHLQPGELFVALRGEQFDGHDYVATCLQQGAAAAMVDQIAMTGRPAAASLLVVDDTRQGLGRLAAYWRNQFSIPLAAITGSNGKTTVKEMLASMLRSASVGDNVLATVGNLNNDIGLPLTLLKLRTHHQYAVIEMGMNHPGEIDLLTRIAQPTVALINNAQPAHLAGLGSVEAVARAKGEIFAGLADNGIAVINQDDPYASLWKSLAAPHRIMTFGLEQAADVSASVRLRADGSDLSLHTPAGDAEIQLQVAGLHNAKNALAATTAALAMGVGLNNIVTGLEQFGGVKGRLQRKQGLGGALVIDDTYNANPASMLAAIEVLAQMPAPRLLVIGDMGELGEDAPSHHARIGSKAKQAGINQLFALGELSREAVATFGAASNNAQHFDSPQALVADLQTHMAPGATVLVKGSRFMQMERVVNLITSAPTEKGAH